MEISKLDDYKLLGEGTFIVVLHATKIPPHIGFTHNGCFFSAKVHSADISIPIKHILSIINRKHISTLFIKVPINGLTSHFLEELFSKYSEGLGKEQTCLHPINQVINSGENHKTIHELVDYLERNNLLLSVHGVHLPHNYQGIPKYGLKEIEQRILNLKLC